MAFLGKLAIKAVEGTLHAVGATPLGKVYDKSADILGTVATAPMRVFGKGAAKTAKNLLFPKLSTFSAASYGIRGEDVAGLIPGASVIDRFAVPFATYEDTISRVNKLRNHISHAHDVYSSAAGRIQRARDFAASVQEDMGSLTTARRLLEDGSLTGMLEPRTGYRTAMLLDPMGTKFKDSAVSLIKHHKLEKIGIFDNHFSRAVGRSLIHQLPAGMDTIGPDFLGDPEQRVPNRRFTSYNEPSKSWVVNTLPPAQPKVDPEHFLHPPASSTNDRNSFLRGSQPHPHMVQSDAQPGFITENEVLYNIMEKGEAHFDPNGEIILDSYRNSTGGEYVDETQVLTGDRDPNGVLISKHPISIGTDQAHDDLINGRTGQNTGNGQRESGINTYQNQYPEGQIAAVLS